MISFDTSVAGQWSKQCAMTDFRFFMPAYIALLAQMLSLSSITQPTRPRDGFLRMLHHSKLSHACAAKLRQNHLIQPQRVFLINHLAEAKRTTNHSPRQQKPVANRNHAVNIDSNRIINSSNNNMTKINSFTNK